MGRFYIPPTPLRFVLVRKCVFVVEKLWEIALADNTGRKSSLVKRYLYLCVIFGRTTNSTNWQRFSKRLSIQETVNTFADRKHQGTCRR